MELLLALREHGRPRRTPTLESLIRQDFQRDSYYLYQSLWNEYENTLHILPAWNGDVIEKDDQGNVKVVVYSDAPTVELFFTPTGGQETSLGSKTMTEKRSEGENGAEGLYTYQMYEGDDKDNTAHKNLYRTWKVPYQDGTLRAVAKDASGREISNTVGRNVVKTAGKAAKIEAELTETELTPTETISATLQSRLQTRMERWFRTQTTA